MNIVFFTQEDPFYVKIFFDEFFKRYQELDDIKAFVISRTMGKKSKYQLARQMYRFYGLIDFLRMSGKYGYARLAGARRVFVGSPSKPPRTHTIRQLAEAYGMNVIVRSDLNSESFHNVIKPLNADLFISVASPMIWKKNLIELPKVGCINIHNAPLPRYKGMMPNFWQMYHEEAVAGITIHRIDAGIDTGEIIAQKKVPIESTDSLDKIIKKTKKIGAGMMIEVIDQFKRGSVVYRKHEGEGSYFSFPTREDVQEFKKKGLRIT